MQNETWTHTHTQHFLSSVVWNTFSLELTQVCKPSLVTIFYSSDEDIFCSSNSQHVKMNLHSSNVVSADTWFTSTLLLCVWQDFKKHILLHMFVNAIKNQDFFFGLYANFLKITSINLEIILKS